jgi:TatD DNase family protein
MNRPLPGDYIDIHTHGGTPSEGVFIVENLMAHLTEAIPSVPGIAFTIGLHPWFIGDNDNEKPLLKIKKFAAQKSIIAIGEAGFDKIRGASPDLQKKVFEEQAIIAEEHKMPLIIHCVKGWDDLLAAHKKLKPSVPWLIHGFHGKIETARQLLDRGMFLSVWYSFALIPESAELIRFIPKERLFLETDGAEVDIRDIYNKVAEDLKMNIADLKSMIFENYNEFFAPQPPKGGVEKLYKSPSLPLRSRSGEAR